MSPNWSPDASKLVFKLSAMIRPAAQRRSLLHGLGIGKGPAERTFEQLRGEFRLHTHHRTRSRA